MRKLLLFSLLVSSLLANVAINGKSILLPISQDVLSVQARNHNVPILKAKNGESFALIGIPYRQKPLKPKKKI